MRARCVCLCFLVGKNWLTTQETTSWSQSSQHHDHNLHIAWLPETRRPNQVESMLPFSPPCVTIIQMMLKTAPAPNATVSSIATCKLGKQHTSQDAGALTKCFWFLGQNRWEKQQDANNNPGNAQFSHMETGNMWLKSLEHKRHTATHRHLSKQQGTWGKQETF